MALYCFINGVSEACTGTLVFNSFFILLCKETIFKQKNYPNQHKNEFLFINKIFEIVQEYQNMQKLKNAELNRISQKVFKLSQKTPLVIVLDNVRSALNVGAVFRTADAFLIEKIFLCGITAVPPNKDILKSALGATETVEWKYAEKTTDALIELKKNGFLIYAVEQTVESISLIDFQPLIKPYDTNKIAVVFGHEVNGINPEALSLCNGCIEVPQYGTKHSLNIAVCAGIVIWDIFVKIKKNTHINLNP